MSILEKTAEAYDEQSRIISSDKPSKDSSGSGLASAYGNFNKSTSYSSVNKTDSSYQSHLGEAYEKSGAGKIKA